MASPPDTPARAETFSDAYTTSSDEDSLNSITFDHFYSEAAAFEKVLAKYGCIEGRETHKDGTNGFEDLVRKDLTPEEQGIASYAAQLRTTGSSPSWTPSPTSSIVEEPETYTEEEDSSLDLSTESCDIPAPVLNRSGTLDSDAWKLEPDEIIRLLQNEFGPLAPDGEEEKLLLETDGGIMKDVAIIGVIHVTTHRLAFHASLMAAHSNTPRGVIRSGSVVIHRKGWRSKRRLWLELTHDMMCTYASSSDSDKIRPVRSVLLSSIKKISPVDPTRPKYLQIIFEKAAESNHSGIAEFDTTEAAADWRRELTGAVFLYRHRRRAALDGSEAEESAGVRFSCPLARIESVSFSDPTLPGLATFLLANDLETPQPLRLGTIYPLPAWQKLPEVVANYQRRRAVYPSTLDDMPIFVDLGPISFEDVESEVESADLEEKAVRNTLALGAQSALWMTRASVHRTVASTGYFVVSTNYIAFWCKYFTLDDLRYRIPVSNVRQAKIFNVHRHCAFGLALEIEGHPDLKFVFRQEKVRDEAISRINTTLKQAHEPRSPSASTSTSSLPDTPTSITSLSRSATGIFSPLERSLAAVIANGHSPRTASKLPKAINLPRDILVKQKSKHFVCLTIGSRGDVQPYIALGLGLMKEGHTVTIVTHEEYRVWVEGFGIRHKQAGGDPGALMKLSVENKMFSPEFFKESIQNFRPWLDQLLIDSWESCQGADVLLESPSAMSGVHIAEALNIPYFRTFTMPWTKTAEFPHAFLSPPVEAPTFNAASYVLFSNVMWTATSGQINRWRRNTLKIGPTNMGHLAQEKIPFIYNFSQAVVPKPLDWGDATNISGYWFLDNPDGVNWTPPADLVEWLAKARKDGKAIVYIGFGSITVPHPNRVTARIVKAVLRADVRAIISKGWSARMSSGLDKDPEVEIPPECYQLDKVPHDWLFPQIDAAVHHGGAGTTGASLRAGIPTLIKPWFGDQFFWASRVQKLGAGLRVPSLHAHDFAEALIKATTSRVMKEKAAAVGEKIRAEDGVHTAIHTIYTYLEHASSYIETMRQSHH